LLQSFQPLSCHFNSEAATPVTFLWSRVALDQTHVCGFPDGGKQWYLFVAAMASQWIWSRS
jgi:hypothetical protein